MKGGGIEGPIDQLVKARCSRSGFAKPTLPRNAWAALGLRPKRRRTDSAARWSGHNPACMQGSGRTRSPLDFFLVRPSGGPKRISTIRIDPRGSTAVVLNCACCAPFHELRDHRTKRMRRLAEQIVRRQAPTPAEMPASLALRPTRSPSPRAERADGRRAARAGESASRLYCSRRTPMHARWMDRCA